jgi:putative IMPACT (imprinted ancient) family translation regulator
MVRAYTQSARAVVESAELLPYQRLSILAFMTDYTAIQRITYLLERESIEIVEREFLAEGVRWVVRATDEILNHFKSEAGRSIEVISR